MTIKNEKTKKLKPLPDTHPAESPLPDTHPDLTPTPTKAETKEIRVIERIIEDKTIAPVDAFGKMTKSQIALVKRTVAKGASDDELRLFIQVCKGANLNPFLRQVFLVPRWDSKEGKEVRTIQVAIDGFRAIAEEGGGYAGNEDAIFKGEKTIEIASKDKKTKKEVTVPVEAKVTVYKIVQGGRYPFSATARWDEYYPGDRMGFMWRTKPHIMLGKCAEALALRKAFPKLLSGMYSSEELDMGKASTAGAEKSKKGFDTVLDMIENAGIIGLEELKRKVAKTTKYDKKQKDQLLKAIESRFNQIDSETK